MAAVTFLKVLENGKTYNSSETSIQAVVLECRKIEKDNPTFNVEEIAAAVVKNLKIKDPVSFVSDDVNSSAAIAYSNGRFIAFLHIDGDNTPLKPLYFQATGAKTKDGKNVYKFQRVHQKRKRNKWVQASANAARSCYCLETGAFQGGDRKTTIVVHRSGGGTSSWSQSSAAHSEASNYDWD